jgi:hypothetical protein
MKVVRELGIVLLFVALSAVAMRPLLCHLHSATFAGYDPQTHLWTLHWLVTHFLEPARIFEGNLYYPYRHAVLFTETDLGTAVLLVPFSPLVKDPVALFNLGILLALAFAGWAFHALVRFLTGSIPAALCAGVLAAFGSNQIRHLPHLDVLTVGWIALFLLGVHGLPRGWGFVLLGALSLSLNVQSNGYYAVASVLLFAVFAIPLLRAGSRHLPRLLALGSLAALLSLPYLLAFRDLRSEHGLHRGLGWATHMAFHPARDLGSSSYLEGALLGREGECLFPGILTLGLASLAVARRAPHSGTCLGATLVLLAVSLGPSLELGAHEIPLPYALIVKIPPLDCMRHPQTFAGVACLLLAVMAGLGLASLRLPAWGGALVVLACGLETLAPPRATAELPREAPPIFKSLEELPPGPALEIPVFNDEILLAAARTERPFLNGQASSFFPKKTWQLDDFIAKEWLSETPEVIDRSNSSFLVDNYPLRYLVLPRGRMGVPGFGSLSRALERSPIFRRVTESVDGDRIYEVREWSE